MPWLSVVSAKDKFQIPCPRCLSISPWLCQPPHQRKHESNPKIQTNPTKKFHLYGPITCFISWFGQSLYSRSPKFHQISTLFSWLNFIELSRSRSLYNGSTYFWLYLIQLINILFKQYANIEQIYVQSNTTLLSYLRKVLLLYFFIDISFLRCCFYIFRKR